MQRTILTFIIFAIFLIGCKKNGNDIANKTTIVFNDSIGLNIHNTIIANNDLDSLIKFIDILSRMKIDNFHSKNTLISAADSLYKSLNIANTNYLTTVFDTKYISIQDIEKNENLAKRAFCESDWKESVSFKDFQEYILPYKLTNEIFDDWRNTLYSYHQELISQHPELEDLDSLYKYHISNTYYALNSETKMQRYLPYGENYKWLSISQEGDCVSRCKYVIYYLRAAGAPATFDYIPNWGNRPYALHAFVGLANKKQQLQKLLENTNSPENLVDNLNAAMTPKYTYVFSPNDLPANMYVQYEKTIPKLYRQTWNKQPSIEKLIAQNSFSEINQQLINPYMLDVTSQYLKTAKVKLYKNIFDSHKIAYLTTFDINGWIPVAYSTFNWWGKAIFMNMGKNILYMPMICKNRMIPFGYPFILDNSGKKRKLICNNDKTISMKLIRKFPVFSYTANHVINFKGCKIEGANDYHFKDAKTLHTIDYYPFGMQVVDFETPDTVRYVHLISPKGEKIRIAEIECFEDSCGIMKKLEDINLKNGKLKGNSLNAFDNDLTSYMVGKWVRLDFGSSKPIKRIKYCPRNDTNYILPENEYELFYWDGQWVSAGRKIANDYFLNYEKVPSGTIYWLRCLSGGNEERIFTYEDNKQIWW